MRKPLGIVVLSSLVLVPGIAFARQPAAAPPAPTAAAAVPEAQPAPAAPSPSNAEPGTWYFALSGDSRDCGNLIVPKIAAAIEKNRETAPVELYWHMGDFRRMYDIDCDVLSRLHPGYDCVLRPAGALAINEMGEYLDRAWSNFLDEQIDPFGALPVYLGIGNHELYSGKTRNDFQKTFQKWLTQKSIHQQRMDDNRRKVGTGPGQGGFRSTDGTPFYHFILHGIDFIYLDNADETSFSADQLLWLQNVVAADLLDPRVRSLVVGMHEALPYSLSRGHAMDATCQGVCSGSQVYDLLARVQTLKHVYVFASHSHLFQEKIFDGQPEHAGQALPGWIVGTAGAEQYLFHEGDPIRYGYVEVAVHPDGTLDVAFRDVTRDSPPVPTWQGAEALTEFCFTSNKRVVSTGGPSLSCACGAVK
jgi:Calcineurin-like phosphoesterase